MVVARFPALVGRSIVAVVIGTALIYASVLVTLSLTARACDTTCTALLQHRAAFEARAAAELHRCEQIMQSPCTPADAGDAYEGATRANERLVAYRRAHRDESLAIVELARQKNAVKPAR
jgi:hypothetical protein